MAFDVMQKVVTAMAAIVVCHEMITRNRPEQGFRKKRVAVARTLVGFLA